MLITIYVTFDLPFSSGSGLETMIFWRQIEQIINKDLLPLKYGL